MYAGTHEKALLTAAFDSLWTFYKCFRSQKGEGAFAPNAPLVPSGFGTASSLAELLGRPFTQNSVAKEKMSYVLPRLNTKKDVDKAIKGSEDKVLVLRFGKETDAVCMQLDDIVSW